ncbi:hypothetical protein, partial [[Mycoplasma] falconis]|uniref:hypothetical protein n=1 Tax=[Mycoplasma] falconis TaxID=92403 RepID=UPI00147711E3
VINTIGIIDDLIEKYEEMLLKFREILILNFKKINENKKNKIKNLFKILNGFSFNSKHYVKKSDFNLLTIKNIGNICIKDDLVQKINNFNVDSKYLLNIGDIVLSRTGEVIKFCIVDKNNYYLNQRVSKIDTNYKAFVFALLNVYQKEITNLAKGSVKLNLSLEDLKNFEVSYSLESLKKYELNNSFLYKQIVYIIQKINKLKLIKQDLLKKYF